jgi:hypothetical protein
MRIPDRLALFILNLISSKKKGSQFEGHKFVFIMSTGRTGTKFFATFFNAHPDIYAVHEPRPSWRLRMWSSAYMQGDVQKEKMAMVMRGMRHKLLDDVKEKIYMESNPFITGFASILPQVFDSPTIIHIIRDPRDYVQSSLNHGTSIGLKNIANRYLPYWYTKTSSSSSRKSGSIMFKVAEFWTAINTYIENNSGKEYYAFKFEDIFGDDENAIKKLEKIVGVDMSKIRKTVTTKEKVNKSKHSVLKSWQDWTPQQCAEIDKLCSPLMQKYGYGIEKEWQQKIKSAGIQVK